jgi:SRSO17 transposase
VGVSRQYCGQVGKQENCRVAGSLSVATWTASLPIAWRLYQPEIWASDPKRRKQPGIPENIQFETKPQIALGQIRRALEQEIAPGIVVADAGYGIDTRFRRGLSELDLEYVVGVQSSATVGIRDRALTRQTVPRIRTTFAATAARPDSSTISGQATGHDSAD